MDAFVGFAGLDDKNLLELMGSVFPGKKKYVTDQNFGLCTVGKTNVVSYDSRKLTLKTDLMPLYYTKVKGVLYFATETKALLMCDKISRSVDKSVLYDFIKLGYFIGDDTLIEGIKKLHAKHTLKYENNRITVKKDWNLELKPGNEPEEFYIKKADELLKNSVKNLLGDCGILLSGGMDSTILTYYASMFSEKPVKTYTVGFAGPNELEHAREVSEYFGTDHHEKFIEVEKEFVEFPEMIWCADAPYMTIYPTYFGTRAAKKDVDSVLCGIGGDELFGGYARYNLFAKRGKFLKIPKILRKTASMGKYLPVTDYYKKGFAYLENLESPEKSWKNAAPIYLSDANDKKAFSPEVQNSANMEGKIHAYFHDNNYNFVQQVCRLETQGGYLEKQHETISRIADTRGLEVRYPIMDPEIIKFAFTTPMSIKMKNGMPKYIMRQILKGKAPETVIKHIKRPAGMRPYDLFKLVLRDYTKQILTPEIVKKRGFFEHKYINNVISKKLKPSRYGDYQTVRNMLAFEIWYKMYIEPEKFEIPKSMKIGAYFE